MTEPSTCRAPGGSQGDSSQNPLLSKTYRMRALLRNPATTAALVRLGQIQTMIGSRLTAWNALPKLTTLGVTRSAGPRSIEIR